MNFRLPARAAVLALAAALALSGCGSGSDGGDEPTSSPTPAATGPSAVDTAAVAGIKVDGDAGAEPTLSFDAPLSVSTATTRLVDAGDGEPLEDGQELAIHFVAFSGVDASRVGSTWEEGEGATDLIIFGDPQLGVINDVLTGANVGARALIANPMTGADGTTQTSIMLIEVASATTLPTRAEGEAVTPAEGLPVVTLDENGKPSIEFPEGFEAPTELVAQTLIKGTGAVVEETQQVVAHYTGWTLDGEVFDSSWERDMPAIFGLQQVIQGWTEGLAGQTVGSQVLLVIPAELAYGEASDTNTHSLAGEALVFVVDILDAQ
ncbi:peptidylprolyl isomerase FKBP-type [Xylanimonas cellulosilytica DSM 15894]|uniref:Peptidyl-prolyl cis-trans isomerase n=1 Tax=Xylanimonas cellulosilytica (strain DSM 15894 / JCM 12276 / CECT 5975 / KCTC 9989 / LMG 20990 / NBRC 107835 / XIL07) TaxID=446471 RepID=D1BW99_XYLCX|nr:FKBP-type peptidyl-prolyl cis-trans isomerase [Xylanimonas cellulosilytica]ACZ31444.1 peptidylprolyl isomerase FKBP-type [Xylanimonas cellulosilytica DSM 15894]